MASRSSRTRLSEAERAERRQRDRERLKQAAEQLLTSEGWQRWGACVPRLGRGGCRCRTSMRKADPRCYRLRLETLT